MEGALEKVMLYNVEFGYMEFCCSRDSVAGPCGFVLEGFVSLGTGLSKWENWNRT